MKHLFSLAIYLIEQYFFTKILTFEVLDISLNIYLDISHKKLWKYNILYIIGMHYIYINDSSESSRKRLKSIKSERGH